MGRRLGPAERCLGAEHCQDKSLLSELGSMRAASQWVLLAALARATTEWCTHGEQEGHLLDCLRARIPPFTPFQDVSNCFLPCVSAARAALGTARGSSRPPVVVSLESYAELLQGVPTWRLSPSHKKGERLRLAESRGNVVVRCPLDDVNLCLRPESGDAEAVLGLLERNLSAGRLRGTVWHMHSFKMYPQGTEWDKATGAVLPSAVLKPSPSLSYFSTNPAFDRHDVVPVPLGVRDHLAGAYGPFKSLRLAPKPNEILDWTSELSKPSAAWRDRDRMLYCDSFRTSWSQRSDGGGHSYGRAKALEALAKNGFECDPTPASHDAYVSGLRASKFVACPRGNGIQVYRVWEVHESRRRRTTLPAATPRDHRR